MILLYHPFCQCQAIPLLFFMSKDTEKKGVAEIIIAKQRHGPIGTVELLWMPQYTKFANLEKGH